MSITTGFAGDEGCALIVAGVAMELHPPELFMITLYMPAVRPDLLFVAWKVVPLSKL
jgi:hypothetical protein